jgi:hypothetical protein
MSRLKFPPLNPRLLRGRETDYTKLREGRAKPGDVTDFKTPSIQQGTLAPRVRNERAGEWNPTDVARPAGRVQSVYGRSKFLFKGSRDDKMNLFGNTVSEQGIKKLSELIRGTDIEVPDPGDERWLDERDRIIEVQRTAGKTEKQIEDYLKVNKPLNRDQNKVKRSASSAAAGGLPSKSRQRATIPTGINNGLAANLTGQTAITREVINLLGRFGPMMDQAEADKVAQQLRVIKPGLRWDEDPIKKRFLQRDDFKITNPKLGFYLALILQTHSSMPAGSPIARTSAQASGFLPGSFNIQTLGALVKAMNSRAFTPFFDLQHNIIMTEDEAKVAATNRGGVFEPQRWYFLIGQDDIQRIIEAIEAEEQQDLTAAEGRRDQQLADLVRQNTATKAALRGRTTGYDKAELVNRLQQARAEKARLQDEIADLTRQGVTIRRGRQIAARQQTINTRVDPAIAAIRADQRQMQADDAALDRAKTAGERVILTQYGDNVVAIQERSRLRKEQSSRAYRGVAPVP